MSSIPSSGRMAPASGPRRRTPDPKSTRPPTARSESARRVRGPGELGDAQLQLVRVRSRRRRSSCPSVSSRSLPAADRRSTCRSPVREVVPPQRAHQAAVGAVQVGQGLRHRARRRRRRHIGPGLGKARDVLQPEAGVHRGQAQLSSISIVSIRSPGFGSRPGSRSRMERQHVHALDSPARRPSGGRPGAAWRRR